MERMFLIIGYSLLACALLACLIFGVRRLRPGLVLSSAFILVYLVVRPLMLLTGFYGSFALLHPLPPRWAPADLWRPMIFTVCISIAFGIGYLSSVPQILIQKMTWLFSTNVKNVRVTCAVTVIALLAFALGREVEVAVLTLGYGYLLFVVSVILLRKSTSSYYWLSIIGALVLAATALILTKERRDWAVAMYVIGWVLVLLKLTSVTSRSAIGVVMLAMVAFVAVALRTAGSVVERLEGATQRRAVLAIVEWELDFPLVYDDLVLLFRQVPKRNEYLYGQSLTKPFVAWVPRDLWPGKPETFSKQVSRTFNPTFYRNGGSEPLTFVGELYWNFGWLAFPFGVLLGYLQAIFDAIYRTGQLLGNLAPQVGGAVRAGGLVLSAMTFYLLRGPLDTVWLCYAGFLACLWICVSLRRMV